MVDVAGGEEVREREFWQGMIRHWLEMALITGFLGLAGVAGWHHDWNQGSFWLIWAAFVDFDDWSHRPKADERQ